MKCCICGPVKNCGPFLDKVFENIEKIGALFEEYKIVIFYDKSKTMQYYINTKREYFGNFNNKLEYKIL